MKKILLITMALCLGLVPVASAGRGQVLYQIWDNTTGALPELKANPNFPNNPTSTWVLPSIDGAVNRVDSAYVAINNFGSRISGYIIPPETARYTFKICSDDNSELWLSTSNDPNNVRRISRVTASAPHQRWNDPDIHIDESDILLEAGNKYYFEAIQDEGSGGDNVSVGWISDGTIIGTTYRVVYGDYVWIPNDWAASIKNKDMAGTVLYEHYDNISGGNVTDLTNNAAYPDNPTGRMMLFNGINGPVNRVDGANVAIDTFGSRITGYIIPPDTANYTFRVCADDRGELRLSTDDNPANAVTIVTMSGYTGNNAFDSDPDVGKSTPIPLKQGKKYYFMALHKEGTGGDNISVGWVNDANSPAVPGTWSDGTANLIGRDYVTAYGYWASIELNPENGTIGVNPSQPLALRWAPGFMPNPILEYRVYFSSDPAIGVPAAGQTPKAVVPASDPKQFVIAANELGEGVDYYWRVDAYGNTGTTLADPNNRAGEMWTFKTVRTKPIVDNPPVNAQGWRDEVVTFSVAARSGEYDDQGVLTYDWRDAAGSLGAPSLPVLTVTIGNDDRTFHCVVSNVNGSQASATANLHVKKWVAHWTFDEGQGYVAHDTSPAEYRNTTVAHDATLIAPSPAGIWRTDGKIGGCIELDGADKYFETFSRASQFGLDGNKPRSASVWAKTRAFNDGGLFEVGNRASQQNFTLRTRNGVNEVEHWRIDFYTTYRDFWTWRQDSSKNANTSFMFPSANEWVHFVETYEDGTVRIYANGVLIVDWATGVTMNTANNNTFRIGQYNTAEFNGLIDDMQVFNFALSREEVIDIYRQGVPDATFCDGTNALDINGDCKIDLSDLAAVVDLWLESNLVN